MIKYYHYSRELKKGTEGASGYDLHAELKQPREMTPFARWKVPTGLFLEMPFGVEAQVRSRSGLALNHGIVVCGDVGTVDSDYRGEIFVTLINLGTSPYVINPGDRIAQLVFAVTIDYFHGGKIDRVSDVNLLTMSQRGSSGFGSTGR